MPIELQVLLLGIISIIVTSWASRYFLLWQSKDISTPLLFGIILIVFLTIFGLLSIVGSTIGMALFFSGVSVVIIIAYIFLQQRVSPEKLAKSEARKTIIIVIVGFIMFSMLLWTEGLKGTLIATSLYVLLAGLYLWLRNKSTRLQ